MITTALICGAGIGLGVATFLRGFIPKQTPLHAALSAITELDRPVDLKAPSPDLVDRIGRPLVPVIESLGLPMDRLRRDLAISDRSLERHLAEKAVLAVFGAALVPVTVALMALGGVAVPWVAPIWVSLILGVVFFFAPDMGVRGEAESRRRDFRHGLGSFLDLVVIGLAGGSGVESALEGAANMGNSSTFVSIRRCLDDARLRQESPWEALGRLGIECGVNELVELAASVGLAGTEGAKVRQSLGAKALSLRSHQLAEAESEAQSASERMSVPVVLLFGGFLIFIGFPAISRVLFNL